MKRTGRILWKVLKWLGVNLPFFLFLGVAFWAGFILDDKESMHFFIILGALYIIYRELYEYRVLLKSAIDNEGEGRHHGSGV